MVFVAFVLAGAAILISGISVAVHISIHNSMFQTEELLKDKLELQQKEIHLLEALHQKDVEQLRLLKDICRDTSERNSGN